MVDHASRVLNVTLVALLFLIAHYVAKLSLSIEIQNTLIYWALLAASVYISVEYLGSWKYVVPVYVVLFAAAEIAYSSGVPVWNERERVRNIYNLGYVFLPDAGKHLQTADLSEGYFKCRYEDTPSAQAMLNKYDKIFELLQLKPGMRVIDLGCGHGQWMTFLESRGVHPTGVTLSNEQARYLKGKGLDVLIADFRRLPPSLHRKYDAITAIGSFEHGPNEHMSYVRAKAFMTGMIKNHTQLYKPDSPCKRFFLSVISFNPLYTWTWRDAIMRYLLERTYSGFYFYGTEFKSIAEDTLDYRLEAVGDLTEDYRYVSIINKSHFGNFSVWESLTPSKLLYALAFMLYDPYWCHRYVNAFSNSWMWQFGGTHERPLPPTHDRPCMLGWYVFKHEPARAKGAFKGTCNAV